MKQWQGLKGLTPVLKEVLLWVKWYQTAPHATEKSCVKGRIDGFSKLFALILRNCHSHTNHRLYQLAAINIEAGASISK